MIIGMNIPSVPRVAAKRSIRRCSREHRICRRGGSASPRCGQFAQPQFGPHLQAGPHLQVFVWGAHLQVGVQVQGLHLHDVPPFSSSGLSESFPAV